MGAVRSFFSVCVKLSIIIYTILIEMKMANYNKWTDLYSNNTRSFNFFYHIMTGRFYPGIKLPWPTIMSNWCTLFILIEASLGIGFVILDHMQELIKKKKFYKAVFIYEMVYNFALSLTVAIVFATSMTTVENLDGCLRYNIITHSRERVYLLVASGLIFVDYVMSKVYIQIMDIYTVFAFLIAFFFINLLHQLFLLLDAIVGVFVFPFVTGLFEIAKKTYEFLSFLFTSPFFFILVYDYCKSNVKWFIVIFFTPYVIPVLFLVFDIVIIVTDLVTNTLPHFDIE